MLRRRFANSPPLFVHSQPNSSGLKMNQCVSKPALQIQKIQTPDNSPHLTATFFSSYKLPETWTLTTLLLFGPVTLLCGTFPCIFLSGGTVKLSLQIPSDWHAPAMCLQLIHSHRCRFTSAAPLILPPEAHQSLSEISPLATYEIFTQRLLWRICAGSPHSKGSVNGASF